MALFYLCSAPLCNRKYKTFARLQEHELRIHSAIVDEEHTRLIELTADNKKQVEHAHKQAIKKEATDVLLQKALQVQEAQQAAHQEYLASEVERYRCVQEAALKLQEEELLARQRELEANKAADAVLLELEAKYRQNALESADVCCICMAEPRDAATIPCGHCNFCEPCITTYHLNNPRKGCPICRKDIMLVCKIHF